VECAVEKEVRRHKKWFSVLEYRMTEIEEELGNKHKAAR
jgi:hypothetical protein